MLAHPALPLPLRPPSSPFSCPFIPASCPSLPLHLHPALPLPLHPTPALHPDPQAPHQPLVTPGAGDPSGRVLGGPGGCRAPRQDQARAGRWSLPTSWGGAVLPTLRHRGLLGSGHCWAQAVGVTPKSPPRFREGLSSPAPHPSAPWRGCEAGGALGCARDRWDGQVEQVEWDRWDRQVTQVGWDRWDRAGSLPAPAKVGRSHAPTQPRPPLQPQPPCAGDASSAVGSKEPTVG